MGSPSGILQSQRPAPHGTEPQSSPLASRACTLARFDAAVLRGLETPSSTASFTATFTASLRPRTFTSRCGNGISIPASFSALWILNRRSEPTNPSGRKTVQARRLGVQSCGCAMSDFSGYRIGVIVPAYRVADQIAQVIRGIPSFVKSISLLRPIFVGSSPRSRINVVNNLTIRLGKAE